MVGSRGAASAAIVAPHADRPRRAQKILRPARIYLSRTTEVCRRAVVVGRPVERRPTAGDAPGRTKLHRTPEGWPHPPCRCSGQSQPHSDHRTDLGRNRSRVARAPARDRRASAENTAGVTSGGDERRSAGLPAVGRGISGPCRARTLSRLRSSTRRASPWGYPTPTVEAPVLVNCGECAGQFELSARRARIYRNEDTAPRCGECRSVRSQVVVTPALRRWWLDRYTLDEIRVMAAELRA